MATPQLLLVPNRYKSGVLYSQLPESGAGDFAVVRATTAYRVNASGILESVASGVPRLDFGVSGCPALLVEASGTNLLTRNLDFANWTASTNLTRADSGIASPVSGFNWALVTSPSGTYSASQSITSVVTLSLDNTKQYFTTLYLRRGTNRYAAIRTGGSNYTDVIDFDTAAIIRTGGNTINKVESSLVNRGTYFEYRTTSQTTTTYVPARLYIVKNPLVPINGTTGIPDAETFVGTETVLALGGNFEVDRRSSLIVAGAAATTRNADVMTVTPPVGTTLITTTFEDGSNVEIIPSGTYTIPNGRIRSIVMT